jgi:hypothetical protein
MKSLTINAARQYSAKAGFTIHLSKRVGPYHDETGSPAFFVKAPVQMRDAVNFVLDLLRTTSDRPFEGGMVWFTRCDVGVSDTGPLGRLAIEALRQAHGDGRSLDVAPAEVFGNRDIAALKVFLLQTLMFGWAGYFLPRNRDLLVNVRSSQRWFFHSDQPGRLKHLFSAMKEWNPTWENSNEDGNHLSV